MARIRTIKPEIWEDQKTGKLEAMAALTFIGMISLSDDEGRGRADPIWLTSRLHPYRICTVSVMEESLNAIGQAGLAVFYAVNGQTYYWIPKFKEHQVINKSKPSRLPPPPASVPDDSGSETVSARAEWNGIRREKEEESDSEGKGSPEGRGAVENVRSVENPPGSPSAGATGLKRIPRAHLGKAEAEARKRELKRQLGTEEQA